MSAPHKPPTMRDVAQLAGVSIQTVSAIINGKPGITPETTERVSVAIQELSYRPYAVARSLRTRQTHTIALIVSDIANPSLSTMASAAEDCAHARGYNLALFNTHDDIARETSTIQQVVQRGLLPVAEIVNDTRHEISIGESPLEVLTQGILLEGRD